MPPHIVDRLLDRCCRFRDCPLCKENGISRGNHRHEGRCLAGEVHAQVELARKRWREAVAGDKRAQRGLLVAGQPPDLGGLTACLSSASLHHREYLKH